MMPLVLTTPVRVLVIGAGRAGMIKVRSALRYQKDVTLLSVDFSTVSQDIDCTQIKADFYQMSVDELSDWDLIYLAIPWPNCPQKKVFINTWAKEIIAQKKLLCVSCQPELGNVINPCSRQVMDYTLTLSSAEMRPKHTIELTDKLAQQFALMFKDKDIDEKIPTL